MELYYPPGILYAKQRVSREAQKDLDWWANALSHAPAMSIALKTREDIYAWSDAASTKGLEAFYTSLMQPTPTYNSAFSITLPHHLAQGPEHINTQEMRAVELVLLHWGMEWIGKSLIIHVDNQAVAHALENRTIRGSPMDILRQCLLLATEYDLDLQARWIPTGDNSLADALSRFDLNRIANLAPQLIHHTQGLPRRGFLMYSNRGFPQ